MSKLDWMSSLTGNLARDEDGAVIGVQWTILTLTEHIDRLPDTLGAAAIEMLQHIPQVQHS